MQKLFALLIPAAIAACATGGPVAERLRGVESAISGVPVPAGSVEQGWYDGGDGVLMAFYNHPWLEEAEVLRFYETQMPEWGWTPLALEAAQPRQRSFEQEGIPVLIGVESEAAGCRISIVRGARGDWGFMPQLRKSQ